jgi:hypothetical protein
MNCKRNRISLLFLVSLFTGLFSMPSHAKVPTVSELKAALIYRMGVYINWKNPPPVKNYCFIGEKGKAISQYLVSMSKEGKIPKSVKITTQYSLDDIDRYQCQVLYIPDVDKSVEEKLQKISHATLTIVGNASQLRYGGIASIEIEARKPRLYVSLKNLKRSNIEIHSRLLSAVTLIDK